MGSRILSTAHGTHRGSFAAVDWALFAAVGTIWGSSFLFMAIGLEAFRPGLVTLLRILFGAAVLWVLPGARTRIDRKDLGSLLLLAITWVAIPFTLFPLAQGSVNSAIAGMLNGAAPIFTAVVATILFRKAPGPRQLIGIPLGFLGVAAIALSAAGHGSSEALGVALILVATVCYGIAFNIAAPLQQKYGSLPVMARILAIGAVLTAPIGLSSIPGSRFDWSSLLAVAAVGVLGTGIAFVLMGRLVGRVGATRASIVGYLIPVVALVLGVLFRNDVVGPIAIGGVALVIAGAYLTSRRESSAPGAVGRQKEPSGANSDPHGAATVDPGAEERAVIGEGKLDATGDLTVLVDPCHLPQGDGQHRVLSRREEPGRLGTIDDVPVGRIDLEHLGRPEVGQPHPVAVRDDRLAAGTRTRSR